MITIYALHGVEGGEINVDNAEEQKLKMDLWYDYRYQQQLSQLDAVDVNEGLEAVRLYSVETHGRVEEFEDAKKLFLSLCEGKVGKFYLWGVEYDQDLSFIEDSEVEQLEKDQIEYEQKCDEED